MPINSRAILVVGGAGYIGSHMVLALQEAGFQPIVLDNLSRGHREAVLNAELIVGEMSDKKLLTQLFMTYRFLAVMHFASFIDVAESIQSPAQYYQNNVAATLNLLDVMLEQKVMHFIFSSSAAVYGEPLYTPIDEDHPLQPINPYGRSKRIIEEVINDYAQSNGLRYAILRYFNAAGADPALRLGERRKTESHLIPLVLQVALKRHQQITIYGQDYPTADGTCVRDYVHVTDLCSAHLLALQVLLEGKSKMCCNLGTGYGYSVQQVIDVAHQVTQQPIRVVKGTRRLGDPAVLVANVTRARTLLSWQPTYSDLETILQHAWDFMISYQ